MKTYSSTRDVKALAATALGTTIAIALFTTAVCAGAAVQRRRNVVDVAYELGYAVLALTLVVGRRRTAD